MTLDLTRLGDVYPERLNTVDMRVAKILRFGRFKANVGFDDDRLLILGSGHRRFSTTPTGPVRPGPMGEAGLKPRPTKPCTQRDVRKPYPADQLRQH